MDNKKNKTIGFGIKDNNKNVFHFDVVIPKDLNKDVNIYENSEITDKELDGSFEFDPSNLKAVISKDRWKLLAKEVEVYFNEHPSDKKYSKSKWKVGINLVDKLLGKELILLIWGINGYKKEYVSNALRNWKSLGREERWWLFNMTNSVKGKYNDEGWWRKAISYILCENPEFEETSDICQEEEVKKNV